MEPWSHGVWCCDQNASRAEEPVGALPCRWSSLAPELWGRVAVRLGPGTFMRLLTCSRGLVLRHERDRLWHFFCHFAGYARRDEGDLPSCTVLLDWQRLFRENALAEA
ncbi:unnamed protein product, partial [Effrenium voratum]